MPSKRTIALIFLFWLLTSGYVAYRDLWPRLFVSGPPPVAIDLADEAAQSVPVRWNIFRGDRKVGRLVTRADYVKHDDTFQFTNVYKQLELEIVSGMKCEIPELVTVVHVTRGGDLREQSLEGRLIANWLGFELSGSAFIHGTVSNGQLLATCEIKSSLWDLKQTLDPVSVPQGQPLNPLLPVNRIANLHLGQSWQVELSDPLADAIGAMIRKRLGEQGSKLLQEKRGALFARVMAEEQHLLWYQNEISCRVIEYKQDHEAIARTWVRASDGKVMKQEAFRGGERLTIEREE